MIDEYMLAPLDVRQEQAFVSLSELYPPDLEHHRSHEALRSLVNAVHCA